jgi:hypothetical protein
MKKNILTILLFGGLWGGSEALLGELLYAHDVPHAAFYLTVIGFFILALSRSFVRWTGAATLIAVAAMLYKFLNVPFFACHLAGIALLGVAWDLSWGLARIRRPAAAAVLSVYLGHLFFMFAMVVVFRSEHWVAQGARGWIDHVGVSGSLTAVVSALLVPFGLKLGERLRRGTTQSGAWALRFAPIASLLLTLGLWSYAIGHKIR